MDKTQVSIPIRPTFENVDDDGVHEPATQQGFSFWLPDSGNILSIALIDANGNQLSQFQGTGFFTGGTLDIPTSYTRGASFDPNFTLNSQNSTVLFTQLQYSQMVYCSLIMDPKQWEQCPLSHVTTSRWQRC